MATKTLGLFWKANEDVLHYKFNNVPLWSQKVTKRIVLSEISKLFDPLGLISPIVITAKIRMQTIWQIKIWWNEVLPDNVTKFWLDYAANMQHVNNIQVPRHVFLSGFDYIEIRGFSHASEKAYSACIYLRTTDNQNNLVAKLLCSKTRVAPLKTITLPRLELSGAFLLSQLYDKIIKSLNLKINRAILWCDSTIVFAWIISAPNTLKLFVGNGISEIQINTWSWLATCAFGI